MATAQGSLPLRVSLGNTVASMVASYNHIHDLIILSGMTQVADDEFTGQAKVFSEDATVGFTQVVRNSSAEPNFNIMGYKVYRHPFLELYIKVNFLDLNVSKVYNAFIGLGFELSPSLSSGGFNPLQKSPVFMLQGIRYSGYGDGTHAENILPFNVEPLTVSCGPSHFWISRKGGINTVRNINNAAFPLWTVDPLSFGVFSSQKNAAVFCVVTPQSIYSENVPAGYFGERINHSSTNTGFNGVGYTSYSNNLWLKRKNCAAGFLIEPEISNTVNGIRVAQAELIIDGQQHTFNFGFINAAVLPSFEVVNINITGVSQSYQSLPSIGSASPAPSGAETNTLSTVVMPLG